MSSNPSIDAFLSYSNDDKNTAKIIKQKLQEVNIDVFLAPDDIDGGSKFLSVIYEKIKTCHIFLVLLSKSYHTSKYADQEIGIALGSAKSIIPICLDNTTPYGFLYEYHCICSNSVDVEEKIPELANLIMKLTDVGKEYIDLLINNLGNSGSFMDAFHWALKLSKYSKLNKDQVMKIADARIHNSQIHNSFMACPIVDGILLNQKKLLPPEIRTQIGL